MRRRGTQAGARHRSAERQTLSAPTFVRGALLSINTRAWRLFFFVFFRRAFCGGEEEGTCRCEASRTLSSLPLRGKTPNLSRPTTLRYAQVSAASKETYVCGKRGLLMGKRGLLPRGKDAKLVAADHAEVYTDVKRALSYGKRDLQKLAYLRYACIQKCQKRPVIWQKRPIIWQKRPTKTSLPEVRASVSSVKKLMYAAKECLLMRKRGLM